MAIPTTWWTWRVQGQERMQGSMMQVRCGNCSVMQLKSGELGAAGCLAAALLEGPWGVAVEA
eukprot:2858977-Rhodomonas_salina.1